MNKKAILPAKPTEERTVAFAGVIFAMSLITFLWTHFDLTGRYLQVDPERTGSVHEQAAVKQ
jgi:hypothetical protein